MKYKCLILDHDDTIVNSTATIHYPSFVEWAKEYAPQAMMSLDDYFRYNFHPGIIKMFKDICKLTDEQIKDQEEFWLKYSSSHIAKAYPGIKEILDEHKKQGGIITVISHSYSKNIIRDYKENNLPIPDATYGWECEPENRKPSPWAIYQILNKFNLKKDEVLVIDDLKPGYDMAKAAGVPFAAAGWANDIEEIESFMRENSKLYFKTVDEFKEHLFQK